MISVIIPVHNGAHLLEQCLAHLRRSTFQDYECIVVDDASTEDITSVAGQYGATLIRLRENGGPARARNRGSELARGNILAFIDADVCVHPDTLSRIEAHFRQHPDADAIMGSYDDTPADQRFISQFKNLFHHYVHHQSHAHARTFWAGCGAVRREVFRKFGGFDESYKRPCIEDIDLGVRLHAAGHRIDLDPTIQVTHLKRWTLLGLIRTDVRDRGIPWFLLMLRDRAMPADLNVTVAHRLSVVLVFLMLLLAGVIVAQQMDALSLLSRTALAVQWLAPLGLSAVVSTLFVLNYDLYRFFARRRGLAFAAATLPMHWLYYAYCGVAVSLGLSIYLWSKLTLQRQSPGGSDTSHGSVSVAHPREQ